MVQHNSIQISVIIPTCFRSIEAVEKCLFALKSQSVSSDEFEVFLVEDGSDQKHQAKVESLLKQYFKHSRYIWQK